MIAKPRKENINYDLFFDMVMTEIKSKYCCKKIRFFDPEVALREITMFSFTRFSNPNEVLKL